MFCLQGEPAPGSLLLTHSPDLARTGPADQARPFILRSEHGKHP